MGLDERAVDGLVPRRIERPETVAALADAIAETHGARESVVLWGGGTRIGVGDPPERYDAAIDLGGLRGVVEHSPPDLVCTVRAGATLRELDEALAPSGQRWPVEAPCSERATVGGTIASAAAGPSRLRYLHPRDWVIGCVAVLGDGTRTRAGGRVVKNVTGYDLSRLYSGTYGTLVALAELTLKLVARAERTATLRAVASDVTAALRLAAELRATRLPLDALAVASGLAARRLGLAETSVLVRLAGPDAAVTRLARAVRERCDAAEAEDAMWERIASLPAHGERVLRLGWPAGHPPPVGVSLDGALVYPGSGIAYVLEPLAPAAVAALRARLEASDGALVIERLSPEEKRAAGGAWGRSRVPAAIARALKDRFDPRGVLAPGRVVATGRR